MDSVTQVVLGASIQGAMLGRWQGRKALVYGGLLATLPDMDVLLDYGDAVADMTYHRGFSHSLFVLAALATAMALVIRRFGPRAAYSGRRLWLTLLLVLCTHPLLDSFTSYGTQLFWPLDTPPVAISSIFIIDPLYTLPLLAAMLVGLCFGLRRSALRWQYAGLALSSLYLASTLGGKWMAESQLQKALQAQGIEAQSTFSSPTPFNTLLWRVVAIEGDQYYEGLVSWLDSQPPVLVALPRHASAADEVLAGSTQYERLRWFTGDRLRFDLIEQQWVATDLRLGMTGYHPFRFALAEQPPDGQAPRVIEHTRLWPAPPADLASLRALGARALDAHYAISLSDLAAPLSLPPHQQP
ncbi:inner membrane protein [Halopseudomonas sabulinigri]|uniref:Inner membrane protein n=1 Tax=Halopseudomonas sabulinigri TaxID=472181 RepID=A0A1H1XDG8_9GAMM|nr:metal-dependent hydrolase [Halopseudomonas sabulinigri]SDT07121.1 inner membrane protein [Halopseudomonas sabulinigri]